MWYSHVKWMSTSHGLLKSHLTLFLFGQHGTFEIREPRPILGVLDMRVRLEVELLVIVERAEGAEGCAGGWGRLPVDMGRHVAWFVRAELVGCCGWLGW